MEITFPFLVGLCLFIFARTSAGQQTSFTIEISDGIVNKRIVSGSSFLKRFLDNSNVRIAGVVSSIRIPLGKPTLLPPQCSSVSENGLFCVDVINGDLFTTMKVSEFWLDEEHFNITLSVESSTPITLRLNFEDACRATSKPYYDLMQSECTSFAFSLPTISNQAQPTQLTFNRIRTSLAQQVLGFRVQVAILGEQSTGKRLVVTETKRNVTTRWPLQPSYTNQSEVYVPVYPAVGGTDLQLRLVLQVVDSGNQSVNLSGDSIRVHLSESWRICKDARCVALYKVWKSNFSSTNDPKCKKDEHFVETYFNRCTNLKPEFTASPKYVEGVIRGCAYNNIFRMETESTYLLINGKKIDFPDFIFSRKRKRRNTADVSSVFPIYPIRSYDDVGQIRCGVFDPERMQLPVLSNATTVSAFVPSFTSNAQLSRQTQNVSFGNMVIITGCRVNSSFPLNSNEAFWMKDGNIFRNVSVFETFPSLPFERFWLQDQGVYQCGIKVAISDKVILSEELRVNPPDLVMDFIRNPTISVVDEEIKISGCLFQSDELARIEPSHIYYEKVNASGTFKLQPDIVPTRFPPLTTPNPRLPLKKRRRRSLLNAIVEPLTITALFQRGEQYRCVVFNNKTMSKPLVSESISTDTFNLNVTFVTLPILTANDQFYGITRCSFKSQLPIDVQHTYAIANGQILDRLSLQQIPGETRSRRAVQKEYDFTQFVLSRYINGNYSCAIHNPQYMLEPALSSVITVNLKPPRFEENRIDNKTVRAGVRTSLCLCHLQNPSLLPEDGDIYLLKEGSDTKLSIEVRLRGIDPEVNEICSSSRYYAYFFPRVELSDQGWYRCAFQPKGLSAPLLSRKMFMSVTELKVILTSAPTIINYGVSGCTYLEREENLANFSYVLLNGTTRYNYTTSASVGKTPDFLVTSYEQNGHFQCVIYDPLRMRDPVVSRSSNYFSLGKPTFLRGGAEPVVINRTAGDEPFDLWASCEVTVSPYLQFKPTEIYWLKNNKVKTLQNATQLVKIPSRADVIYRFQNPTRQSVFEEEGIYQCVVDFVGLEAPIVGRTFNVIINDLPISFVSNPAIIRFSFTGCQISTKNFNAIQNNTEIIFTSFNGTVTRMMAVFRGVPIKGQIYQTQTIQIDSFDQYGSYRCEVTNPLYLKKPLISTNSSLLSSVKFPKFTFNPRGTINNTHVPWGIPYTIKGCRFQTTFLKGFDAYWLKDGVKLLASLIEPLEGVGEVAFSDLSFRSLTTENNGTYRCVLELSGNPIQYSSPFHLQIQKTDVEFISKPEWIFSNNEIKLTGCRYKSPINMYPYSYWLLDGKYKVAAIPNHDILDSGVQFQFKDLKMESFNMTGNYECVIENVNIRGQKVVSQKALFPDHRVLDIVPKFTKHPVSTYSNTTGGLLRIHGCAYQSLIPLGENDQAFYLINNVKKQHVLGLLIDGDGDGSGDGTDRSKEDEGVDRHDSPSITFIPYTKRASSYEDQGFYQCGITIHGPKGLGGPLSRTILSETTDVQFLDVAAATVDIRMKKDWNENLENPLSDAFRELERTIVQELQAVLPTERGFKPLVRVLEFKKGSIISKTQILYPNVTQELRMKKCQEFISLANPLKQSHTLQVDSINALALDCCKEDTTGEESFKGVEHFPDTLVSQNFINKCTYNPSTTSSRNCRGNLKNGPKWEKVNFAKCPAKSPVTNSLIKLSNIKLCDDTNIENGCQTPVEVSGNLSQLINSGNKITTRQDLEYISIILKSLATHATAFLPNKTKEAETITVNVLKTISSIIDSDRKIVTQAQKSAQTSTTILRYLDVIAWRLGEIIATTNRTISIEIEQPNVALAIKYSNPVNLSVIGAQSINGNLSLGFQTIINETVLASAKVPAETFKNKSQIVYSFLFRNDILFQTGKQLKALDTGALFTSSLSSKVLAVSVGKEKIENLTLPVLFTFKKIEKIPPKETQIVDDICTFWDPEIPTSFPKVFGSWKRQGCIKVFENDDEVQCECDHLINFALLLDVSQSRANPLELQIITWIGCGVSLAGLFLTLLSYGIFKNLRKKLPPKILISLCISLMALLIVFLVGIERESTGSKTGCQVVAGVLHYFMLTTFIWMLVEAVNLYRNFVKIFRAGNNGKFFKRASMASWGIPLIVVIVTGVVEPGNLGNEKFCVVLGDSFYFAVLLPVALILFVNLVVLIMVMRSLINKSKSRISSTQRQTGKVQARIALACSTLLGLTWVLALLAVGDLRYTFQLLFTIFNSLQGFFIFLFYTVMNKEVQKEWKSVLNIGSKTDSTTNSSQPVTTTLPKSKVYLNEAYNDSHGNTTGELDLSSSTGHLIKSRLNNGTYKQTSFKS